MVKAARFSRFGGPRVLEIVWVLRWDQTRLPTAQRDKALQALESWLVRRALCRVTSKDVNRMVLDCCVP